MWPIFIVGGVLLAFVYYRNQRADAAAKGTDQDATMDVQPAGLVPNPSPVAGDLASVANRIPQPAPGVSISAATGERTSAGERSVTITALPTEPVGEPVETREIVRAVSSLSSTDVKTAVDTTSQRTAGSGDALGDVAPDLSATATAEGYGLREVEDGVFDAALGVPTLDMQGPAALADTTAAVENADSLTDPDPFIG